MKPAVILRIMCLGPCSWNQKLQFWSFPSRLAGSDEAEDEGQWKLYFKLYCFLDVESMPKEGVEFAFMFEQVCFITYWAFF